MEFLMLTVYLWIQYKVCVLVSLIDLFIKLTIHMLNVWRHRRRRNKRYLIMATTQPNLTLNYCGISTGWYCCLSWREEGEREREKYRLIMGFLCVIKTLKFRNNWVVAFLEFEEKRIPRKKNLLQSSIRYIIRSLWVCPLIVCMFLIVFISLALFFFLFSSFYRDFRPTTLGKKQEKIRLRLYKTYAWGFAFLITAIAAVIDYLPQSHNLPRPRFGEKTCWFVGKYHFCFSYTMFLSLHHHSTNVFIHAVQLIICC